eukprot:14509956-Alexandrium_andersonii.AAC.1
MSIFSNIIWTQMDGSLIQLASSLFSATKGSTATFDSLASANPMLGDLAAAFGNSARLELFLGLRTDYTLA